MTITGYNKITVAGGPQEPLKVTTNGNETTTIYSSLKKLSPGPAPDCLESFTVLSIQFVLRGTSRPKYEVTYNPCGPPGYVSVSIGGRVASTYQVDCNFKKALLAALPRKGAEATRISLVSSCPN
jgi:hypothetical protein